MKKLKYVQGNLEQIGQKETPLFSAQNLILQVIETEEIALQPVHESSFLSLYFGQEWQSLPQKPYLSIWSVMIYL